MRKLMLVLPTVAALLTLGTGAAQAANAPVPDSLSATVLGDIDGTAGLYTQQFAHQYTATQGTFSLNPDNTKSLVLGFSGALGLQLCNATTGNVAQIGAIENPPGSHSFTIGYLTGTLDPADGIGGDPCDGNSFLGFSALYNAGTFFALGSVPAGHSVEARIEEKFIHGFPIGVLFTAEDVTTGVADFQQFVPNSVFAFGFFNEAAAGISTNLNVLSAPAVNDIADFSGLTATDMAGVTHGYAAWNAVRVASSGNALPPFLLEPAFVNPSTFIRTWHPGHRYYYGEKGNRRYRWIKGFWTSTGGGPTSYELLGGTPIGF